MKQQYSFTDEELRVAAASVCASMLDAVEAIPSGEREFSERFLDKMNALLSLDRLRRKRRQLWHRVASVFLAFLLGTSIFLATNPEARATFLAWVREVYENSVLYRFFGKPAENFPRYELGWIPQGFILDSEIETDIDGNKQRNLLYENPESGGSFVFCYQTISEDIEMVVGGLEGEALPDSEVILINGIACQYYPAGDFGISSLVWVDEKLGLVFYLDSNLEKSVMLHIAESVHLANLTK